MKERLRAAWERVPRFKRDTVWLWAYAVLPTLMLVTAVGLRRIDPPVLQDFRYRVFDQFQNLKPRAYKGCVLPPQEEGAAGPGRAPAKNPPCEPETPPVRIIDIDDETLARKGQWPWPRTLLSRLVLRLSEMGAGVIAFDAVFAEPDRTSPAAIRAELPATAEYMFFRDQLKKLPDHDKIFAATAAGLPIVTGFSFVPQKNAARPKLKAAYLLSSKLKEGAGIASVSSLEKRGASGQGTELEVQSIHDYLPDIYHGTVNNIGILEDAASGNGSFNTVPDRDNIIRRVPMIFRLADQAYPSLAAEALRVAVGGRGYKVAASGASGQLDFEGGGINRIVLPTADRGLSFNVPTDAEGRVVLYDTGRRPERYISAWRILDDPKFDPAEVEGKILFIGTSAAGLKDQRATPLQNIVAGVDVHAQLVEQVLFGEYLHRPAWSKPVEILMMLVFGLILIGSISRVGALLSAIFAAAGIGAAVWLSWYAFSVKNLLIDPIYFSLVIGSIYVTVTLIDYLKNEAEKKQVRGAFSRYMSPALVEQLAQDPSRLKLGGEMRDLTLMFSDIRGFTTLSEQFDASGLTQFINRYLTPMTEIILEKGGTIDKYMGDCIMAFWNAPLDEPGHADLACRAALRMRDDLKHLNEVWRAETEAEGKVYLPINAGIGLNSGECCVGNMGSDQRFDYSVLGDEVNLASRLEGQSKSYGVDIVIGKNTLDRIHGFGTIELDLIKVKGKTVPVHIYTLLTDPERAAAPEFKKLAEANAAMIIAYRAQKWAEAEELMRQCRGFGYKLDKFYDLYQARIDAYRENSPGQDWDGVFTATSK